jgi:predicted nucleotidyltransferase
MMSTGRIKRGYFSSDAVDLMRLLQLHEVRYLLIGGEAVIYYGHARLTGDIDFFYDFQNDNSARLFDALREFWRGEIPGIEKKEELAAENVILQFGRPPYRIDLVSSIDGVVFDRAWENGVWLEIEGEMTGADSLRFKLIGLSDLIANKKASNRPKDQEDLKFLERINQ